MNALADYTTLCRKVRKLLRWERRDRLWQQQHPHKFLLCWAGALAVCLGCWAGVIGFIYQEVQR